VYYDDVPINIAAGTQLDVLFFDIDRVEVLRGPQGTLYGESSTGGRIQHK
jgi:iron complex outermembrane receptor protein|tara:strand:+ start:124 stop:273 length:150 start_codon:yes stop_codon:yes gene_type:complete